MAKRRGNAEGSIYRDARGFYRAAVSLNNGKRKYLSGKTRDEVAKKLTAALDAHDKRLPVPGLRLTTARYLTDWLADTVKPSRKPLTYIGTGASWTTTSSRLLARCHSHASGLRTSRESRRR